MKVYLLFLLLLIVNFANGQTKYVCCSKLNLRNNPNVEGVILTTLKLGTEVTPIENAGPDWIKVKVGQTTGFVQSSCISVSAPVVSKKEEATVLICNSSSAYAYHSYECSGINRCKSTISKVSISEATRKEYRPCKICY